MATKRVKSCDGKAEKHDNLDTAVAVDRISKLPDPVIHHILSFVPTVYAVRMSLLSRRWRRMWYSIPTLRFSELDGFHCRESFDMFVEQCLIHRSVATRYIADSAVTSLKLDVCFSADIGMPPVNRWSKSPIILNDVKRLSIFARPENYGLDNEENRPSVALNGRSLSIIKLRGVTLDDSCSMNLPSLKSLHLSYVPFHNNVNDTLRNLMTGCPSLEKLVLENCYPCENIKISSPSLKLLLIDADFDFVEVDALNLQSLVLHGYSLPQMSFSSCGAIRDLSLSNVCNETYQNCGHQISKLTRLENLTLKIGSDCHSEQHINVSNPTLKCFSLINYSIVELKVSTETPNLGSFKYIGGAEISMTMKTPNPQLSGSFTFYESFQSEPDWYTNLITFLSNINYSWKSLSLCSNVEKDLIIPETMRKTCCPPCPNLKHLKVLIHCELTRKSELRKAMEWISPSLETLSIESSKRHINFEYVSSSWLSQHDRTKAPHEI